MWFNADSFKELCVQIQHISDTSDLLGCVGNNLAVEHVSNNNGDLSVSDLIIPPATSVVQDELAKLAVEWYELDHRTFGKSYSTPYDINEGEGKGAGLLPQMHIRLLSGLADMQTLSFESLKAGGGGQDPGGLSLAEQDEYLKELSGIFSRVPSFLETDNRTRGLVGTSPSPSTGGIAGAGVG